MGKEWVKENWRSLALVVGVVVVGVVVLSAVNEILGSIDRSGPTSAALLVFACLVGALVALAFAPNGGKFAQAGLVLVIAVFAWIAVAPSLVPSLTSPDGEWRLGAARVDDDLRLIEWRCSPDGATGSVANIGEHTVNGLVEVTVAPEDGDRERYTVPVLIVGSGEGRRWSLNLTQARFPAPECQARVTDARLAGASVSRRI